MVQQGQIDHLLQETGQIEPPASLVQQAFLCGSGTIMSE